MVGIVPCAATFLEALASFSLSSGSEEKLTESALEVPAYDEDDDEDEGDEEEFSVDASEGNETSSFQILPFSDYPEGNNVVTV